MDTNLKAKPSCPKEFFAKLYGHLEDKKSEQDDKEKNLNFEKSESDRSKNSADDKDIVNRYQGPFPFIPTVISRSVPGFCGDAAFTAGFTAFCK